MPFKDNVNIKALGDEIYLYENFLTKEECNSIYKDLRSFNEDAWHVRDKYPIPAFSPKMNVTKLIVERLMTITDEYSINHNEVFNRLSVGDSWGEHADNAEFSEIIEKSKLLKDEDKFKLVDNTVYGLVVYINDDYEGGEIYYTHQGISHKPKAGDLVIHSSEEKCRHGVKPVTSGVRYGWSSNFGNLIKVPIDK